MPEWTLSGGLARGGWVYVHESGARAYIHVNDDGYIDVATWDPGSGDERAFPDREALETIVGMDLERMRESGRGDDQAMLALSGLGGFSSVRSYRGRKKKWDRATLARFVDNVVEHGVPVASKQWGVKERQGRAVMQKAKAEGLARIEASGGRNIYFRCEDGSDLGDTARTRGDWHRRNWFEMEKKRRQLQANWERQQLPSRVPDARQLSQFTADLAAADDDRCEARIGDPKRVGVGRQCSLRAGHTGEHFALLATRPPAG